MLIFLTILAAFSAVMTMVLVARRRKAHLLEQNNSKKLNAEHFRPLFVPTDEELRAVEREEKAKLAAKEHETERRLAEAKQERVCELEKKWLASPAKKTLGELLLAASETGSAKLYSEIAGNVIKSWREDKIENLSARGLAELLESHLGIITQQERTSGAAFWLREEIQKLRTKSEEQK